jgi:hypothetical protein
MDSFDGVDGVDGAHEASYPDVDPYGQVDAGGSDLDDAHQLVVTGPDGAHIELGSADLSSSGDPDDLDSTTAVSADGATIGVYTDHDGDGTVDQIIDVNADGSYTLYVQDDHDDWGIGQTGHITGDGDVVADAYPVDDAPSEPTLLAQSGSADIVLTGADGTRHELGAPDQDLDGDGVPESVAARTADGDLVIVSDTDHDGIPDQLIQVSADTGQVSWAQPAADGGWVQMHTGHVGADGSLVVDPEPDEASDRVVVPVDGGTFDAGPATIDTDGDGVPDTVAVEGPQGSTLYYQDTDGDGVADRAWTSDADGRVVAEYALDAKSGAWTTTT